MTFPKIGFLFPGQGAQSVGMGKDLCDEFPTARKIFDQADEILGMSIRKVCFEGPEETLTETRHAQPAIFVTSFAALSVLKEKFPDLHPSFAAGLSLGEFTALVAAGSITFEDGLRLVKCRADAMEKSAGLHPGTMAFIMGLTEQDCGNIAREAGCEVANLNAQDQIVLSGTVPSIEKACTLAEGYGAKRAMKLKVGGAFHSTLMREAKNDLEEALRKTPIKTPACIFIPNVTAAKASDPEQIRSFLALQLMSPVRWSYTMKTAEAEGISAFLEIGPGKVLKGLSRQTTPAAEVHPCGKASDFLKLAEILKPITA